MIQIQNDINIKQINKLKNKRVNDKIQQKVHTVNLKQSIKQIDNLNRQSKQIIKQMNKKVVYQQQKFYNYYQHPTLQSPFSTIEHHQSTLNHQELIFEHINNINNQQLKLNHNHINQSYQLSNHINQPISSLNSIQQFNENQLNQLQNIHLQIQLDDGNIQTIYPKINDNPYQLAQLFCIKHQLDSQMLQLLTINITKTINKLKSYFINHNTNQNNTNQNKSQNKLSNKLSNKLPQNKSQNILSNQLPNTLLNKLSNTLLNKQSNKINKFKTQPNQYIAQKKYIHNVDNEFKSYSKSYLSISKQFYKQLPQQKSIQLNKQLPRQINQLPLKYNPSSRVLHLNKQLPQQGTQLPLKSNPSSRVLQPNKQLPQQVTQLPLKSNLSSRVLQPQTSRKTIINKQKLTRSTSQLNQCTHSPQINKISQQICSLKPHYKSNKRQSQYNSIKTQNSLNTQPFDQNQISKFQQFNKQNQHHTVFDYLYQNSKIKKIKKQQQMNSFIKRNKYFQPQINPISRKLVGNKSFQQRLNRNRQSKVTNSKNKSFINSVQKYKSKFISSVQKSINKNNIQHTNILHPNTSGFNIQRKPIISQSLKILAKQHPQLNKESIKKPIYYSTKNIIKYPPSSQTQKLYQKQKQKSFKKIFQLLDSDKDGIISILNINLLNGIQQKLIQILFPVLQQLQILQTQLNSYQFCLAMDKLFKKLSLQEKGYLLKYYKIQQKHSQHILISNQQSIMTSLSTQLVNHTQRKNVSVYQYSKIREQLKQQKLQQQRILKQKFMMKNCTFHPKINPKKTIYF